MCLELTKGYFQGVEDVLINLSEKLGPLAITTIRDNIYDEIVHGKWWNLASFFESLNNTLLSKNTMFAERITKMQEITSAKSGVIVYIFLDLFCFSLIFQSLQKLHLSLVDLKHMSCITMNQETLKLKNVSIRS